jgi:hypothetical protein
MRRSEIAAKGTLNRIRVGVVLSLTIVMAITIGVSAWSAASASALEPWWNVASFAAPGHLPPGGKGKLEVYVTNVGDAAVNASTSPVKIVDKLPPGVRANEASGNGGFRGLIGEAKCMVEAGGSMVLCEYSTSAEEPLPPYEQVEVNIEVEISTNAAGQEVNEVKVTGGGAPSVSMSEKVTVSSTPTPFGISTYRLKAEEEGGIADTQAGSHPFQLTSTIMLNQLSEPEQSPAQTKDLHFLLPPGVIGNPTVASQCPDQIFSENGDLNLCAPNTVVGVAVVSLYEELVEGVVTVSVPLFNLRPARGEPARFGFDVLSVPIVLNTSVRTGEDYGVTVSVENITQVQTFIGSRVTFWGVPGDTRHDSARDWACLGYHWPRLFQRETGEVCHPSSKSTVPSPFLSMPTQCSAPLVTSVTGDSWEALGKATQNAGPVVDTFPEDMDGCNRLGVSPEIRVSPDVANASTPTGIDVRVHVPQVAALNPTGIAESEVKEIEVALPKGVTLNPGGAGGLQACALLTGRGGAQETLEAEGTISGINLETHQPANCPPQSKVATVAIHTPLLPNPLEGAVYLAKPDPLGTLELGDNPFNSLIAMYLVAEDPVSGTLVKLPMHVVPNEQTGQLVATVESPQLPFEEAELHFFGGSRAPLATPGLCGSYTTNAVFTPWSGGQPAPSSATFEITNGTNGSACPSDPRPFAPEFAAGTTNVQAGGFSELRTTMGHPDPDQELGGLKMTLPPGLMGTLSSVKLCQEPQAAEGTCGPESLIGHVTVTAGLGSTPAVVARPGDVYITGPYDGAPYGLSIANAAETGPFDLQKGTPCDCVVVRAKIEVDPHTAQLTVTSDPLPLMLKGIPLDLQHVSVQVGRPGFTFNPTSCEKMAITGSMTGSEGATAAISEPFQVTDCASLAFEPGFKASTSAQTSRTDGASLTVKLVPPAQGPQNVLGGSSTSKPEEANIKSVKVELPKQLPSRLTTLQKACTAQQFDANPAGCPAASRVGVAVARTPLVSNPLSGPAYFVSRGNEAFPQLVIVLQGEGITVDVVGDTFISKAGITSSTFASIPDVPISSFELTLPEGPFSALSANGALCSQTLVMPTEFKGQNGAQLKQNTSIEVTGCATAMSFTKHVSRRTAALRIYVPAKGKVKVSGRGLTSVTKSVGGRGTITVNVSPDQRSARKFTTDVTVTFIAASGRRQAKGATLRFGR